MLDDKRTSVFNVSNNYTNNLEVFEIMEKVVKLIYKIDMQIDPSMKVSVQVKKEEKIVICPFVQQRKKGIGK